MILTFPFTFFKSMPNSNLPAKLSRRQVLQTAVAAAAFQAFSTTHAMASTMSQSSNSSGRIYVESEFAPLRTVVLAESELSVPQSALSGKNAAFLAKDNGPQLKAGEDFGVAFPEKQAAWEREREMLGAVFLKHGV